MKYQGLKASAEVIDPEDDIRFKDKKFKSYIAIVKLLKLRERVTVCLASPQGVLGDLVLGYGEVERVNKKTYSVPRVLSQEYCPKSTNIRRKNNGVVSIHSNYLMLGIVSNGL